MFESDSLPIIFAPDALGTLHHIDDVPNGLGCECVCPACSQELIAKNGGKKRIHHFAHKRETCQWSTEFIITALAEEILNDTRQMAFPALWYKDASSKAAVEISPARLLRVTSTRVEQISGRGAPELIITCRAAKEEKSFAVVFSLVHGLKSDEIDKLEKAGFDTVLIDFKSQLYNRKQEAGKHFDRIKIVAAYQDKSYIQQTLEGMNCAYKSWVINARRSLAEKTSREKYQAWLKEQERIRAEKEKKRIEQERAAAELRTQHLKQIAQARADKQKQEERVKHFKTKEVAQIKPENSTFVSTLNQIESQDIQARDSLGRRWVKCEKCSQVKLTEEFMIYGGPGRINLGICNECARSS